MLKVNIKDLEEITKFLDNLAKGVTVTSSKAKKLSQMIKDKYTEIKPDYDRTN